MTTGASGSAGSPLGFTGEGDGTGDGPFGPVGLLAIGYRVSIGMKIPFRLLSSSGKSPGPASSHTSSNKSQPLAIILWPSETILCLVTIALMATSKTYVAGPEW